MENKYNDYELMSPEQMELIAKKYRQEMGHKNKLKTFAINSKLGNLLQELINCYETLQFVCPLKFYNSYKDIFIRHKNVLIKLNENLGYKDNYMCRLNVYKYSQILKMIVCRLLKLFKVYWNDLNDEKNAEVVFSLIEQIINLQ